MKRFILSVIALFTFSGVFAQQSVDLKLQGKQRVQVVLRGPIPSYPIVLSLDASYIREKECVVVVLKGDNINDGPRITASNMKDQITHLMFPFHWIGVPYHEVIFKSYFNDTYNSTIKLDPPMKNQIANSKNGGNLIFKPIFEVDNGELMNSITKNMLSLQGDEFELKIKVLDLNTPVKLTINNVIPIRAEKEGSLQSNKLFLKYISDSSTVIFNIPEDKCAKRYELIQQYLDTNNTMRNELLGLYDYAYSNPNDTSEIIRKQWHLVFRHETTLEKIDTTIECKELRQQFRTFIENYNEMLNVTPFTPDSLSKMIEELRPIYDSLVYGGDISYTSCQEQKEKAALIIAGLELDENAFNSLSEPHSYLVHQFNDLKATIDGFICPEEIDSFEEPVAEEPVSDSDPLPKPRPNTSRCNCRVITDAMTAINRLWNKNELGGKLRKARYDAIVRDTDDYLRTLSTSCQQSACKTAIDQYKKAQVEYKKHFK